MPTSVNLRWNSDRVVTRARGVLLARAQVAAPALEAQVKARLGTPFPPASAPGQPPHRRTGALQRGVHATARLLNNRVRVSLTVLASYARFLQRGTSRMLARPFAGLPPDARLVVDFLSGRRKS